ncbi:LysR family transcriptional regulator [Streptomyces sp. NPDC057623]|uniref:LysR family transcriptional regulator n=1 Tax=Streptomyces sp. NPDC057623 TaxID=3346187 RepID=UPI0036C4DEFD
MPRQPRKPASPCTRSQGQRPCGQRTDTDAADAAHRGTRWPSRSSGPPRPPLKILATSSPGRPASSRAAARLHLVQSALSVSIRSLERELGGRLFDRTTRRVELTDAGRVLLAEARSALSAVDAARDAVAAAHGGLGGTVPLGRRTR